jgi:hypothetical protein
MEHNMDGLTYSPGAVTVGARVRYRPDYIRCMSMSAHLHDARGTVRGMMPVGNSFLANVHWDGGAFLGLSPQVFVGYLVREKGVQSCVH